MKNFIGKYQQQEQENQVFLGKKLEIQVNLYDYPERCQCNGFIWVSGCQRSDCHYDYPSESRTNPDKPECQLQRFNPGFEGL